MCIPSGCGGRTRGGKKKGQVTGQGLLHALYSSNTDILSGSDTSIHFTANINLNISISVFSGMFVLVINLKTTLCNQISALCLRHHK